MVLRTENEFLGRSHHVQRKGDFVLVSFALQPAQHTGRVEHAAGGEQDEGQAGNDGQGIAGNV